MIQPQEMVMLLVGPNSTQKNGLPFLAGAAHWHAEQDRGQLKPEAFCRTAWLEIEDGPNMMKT